MTQPKLELCELTDATADGVESYSPFCLKVHRALSAAGLAYTSRRGAAPGAFKALNKAAQVPVLIVDGEPISDSTRILKAIAKLAPGTIEGKTAAEQAESRLWEDFADTSLNGFLVASRWADDRNWPAVKERYFGKAPAFVRALIAPRIRKQVLTTLVDRDVTRSGLDACWERFESILSDLDVRAPRSGCWLGESLSFADLGIFAQLQSLRTRLTPWQKEQVESHPALTAYLDRVDVRTRKQGYKALAA